MILEFVGVGSFFAKTNFNTNLVINGNILIDCGFTAGINLYQNFLIADFNFLPLFYNCRGD